MTAAAKKRLTLPDTESEKALKATKLNTELSPPKYQVVALKLLDESPTNPRKHFDAAKLAELAADIRQHGVMQPLVVRPVKGERFELVAGHRRLRAARLAGLAEVPVLVSELSDLEAAERQIVENDQREDLSPLERAQGYAALKKEHNLTDTQIAEKTGKSESSIRAALKLNELGPEGLAALKDGKLTASTAQLVAQLPKSLQKRLIEQALDDYMINPDQDDVPMSFRALKEFIRRDFMLELGKKVCFDVADVSLSDAGACIVCPKNTEVAGVFDDVKGAHCLDVECFRRKEDTWLARELEGGKLVLGRKEAAKHLNGFDGKPGFGSSYVLASETKGIDKSKVVTALSPAGGVVKLVARLDVPELQKKAAKEAQSKGDQQAQWDKEDAKRRAKNELEKAVDAKVNVVLVARMEKKLSAADEKLLWRWLANIAMDFQQNDVLERRGLHEVDDLKAALDKMTLEQLRGFVFECNNGYNTYGVDWEKHFKVDRKKYEAEVKAEAKAAEKGEAKPAPAKKAGKKKAA